MKNMTAMLAAWVALSVLTPSIASFGVLESVARADARGDKLNLYVEIHNMFSTSMRAQYDNYAPTLEGLDPEHPCTADRHPGGNMYHAGDATGTIPGYRRRLRRAPRLPQDRLATAMLDAAAIQGPAWNGAFDYYGRRLYTNDACAQGNVFHRQLMSAFQAYFAADTELLASIDAESRARRASALQDTERQHGRHFRYFQLYLMNEVETIRDLLSASSLDLDALARASQAIAAGVAEIKPRAESSPPETHRELSEGHYLALLLRLESLVLATDALIGSMRAPESRHNDRQRQLRDYDRALSGTINAANGVRYSDRVH